MSEGWVSIHRQIWENPLWFKERFTQAQAWIDLILLANHKPSKIRIRGNDIGVNRGQIARSMETLAERWKWNRKTVSRYISELEKWGMIGQQKTVAITIITIKNYDSYQIDGQQNGQQSTQQNGQQKRDRTDTYNKNNNDNNDNNSVEKEILKWLKKHDKKNPEGYLSWIMKDYSNVIDRAWKKSKSSALVNSPSDLIELCKHLQKNI